jgi:demethoxyubiquinone hydroxylase (CLK1/Coq7/Cat5 family)
MREHKGAIEGLEHTVGVLAEDMKANMDGLSAMILDRSESMGQIKKWIDSNGDQMGSMVQDMDAERMQMSARISEVEKALAALGNSPKDDDVSDGIQSLQAAVQQQAKALLDTIEYVNQLHGRLSVGQAGLALQEAGDTAVLFAEVDDLRSTEAKHSKKLEASMAAMKDAVRQEEWHVDHLEERLGQTEDCCKMLEALLRQQGILNGAGGAAGMKTALADANTKAESLTNQVNDLRRLLESKLKQVDMANSHLPGRVQLLEEEDLRILKRLDELEKQPARPRSRDVAVQHNVVSKKMPGADEAKTYVDPVTGFTQRYVSSSTNGTAPGIQQALYRPVVEPVMKKSEPSWYSQLIGTQ